MYSLYLHVANEEGIVVDVEEMPDPRDVYILGRNPRKRDGKEVHYVLTEVNTILFPWHRLNFVEVLPGAEEEDVVSFIRE